MYIKYAPHITKENKLDEDKGNTVTNIHANSVKALYSLKNSVLGWFYQIYRKWIPFQK